MSKAFRKSILPLLLLVLSGHFFIPASAHQSIVRYAQLKVRQAGAVMESDLHRHTLVAGYNITDRKSIEKVYFEEKEEDSPDLSLTRTYNCDRSYFPDFQAGVPGYYLSQISKVAFHCVDQIHFSSRIYLILRVFRI